MNSVDLQELNDYVFRTDADELRTCADENRTDASKLRTCADENCTDAEGAEMHKPDMDTAIPNVVINNLAQINIQNIVYADQSSYNNGHFIPVFQDAIRAIACNTCVKHGTIRVLIYILGTVDEKNCFCEKLSDIAKNLNCSEDTVSRAIKQLAGMQIICKKEGGRERSLYELSDKILNPRLAYKGNTRRLRRDAMPLLLDPVTFKTLIPSTFKNIILPE